MKADFSSGSVVFNSGYTSDSPSDLSKYMQIPESHTPRIDFNGRSEVEALIFLESPGEMLTHSHGLDYFSKGREVPKICCKFIHKDWG